MVPVEHENLHFRRGDGIAAGRRIGPRLLFQNVIRLLPPNL